MGELQATVEFCVELGKFYNVDLFQRGFYQIRSTLKVSPKLPVKIEASISEDYRGSDLVLPAWVSNGVAISKTFQILYRNEEVTLGDVIVFKVHILVDTQKIEETVDHADFQLVVELWFTDQTFCAEQQNSIQCVSSRTLNLHFVASKGLHHHLPILFDYFHLSAITLTVHASLLAVHQQCISTARPSGKPGWLVNSPKIGGLAGVGGDSAGKLSSSPLETTFFGGSALLKSGCSASRLSHARHVHKEMCSIVLAAYESLQSKLQEYMKLLPSWQQVHIESTDCYAKLQNLSDFTKNVDSEEDLIAKANSSLAKICAENIILWRHFLKIVIHRDRVRQHMAREHHLHRVKRFAEGFFIIEHERNAILSCSDASYQMYQTVSDATRRSRYFTMMPPLGVESADMDGTTETLPIIFEDQYQESMSRSSRCSRASDSELNIQDISVNMKSLENRRHSKECVISRQDAVSEGCVQSSSSPCLEAQIDPRQRRSPSVDTGKSLQNSSNNHASVKIKETRSLMANLNCLSMALSSSSTIPLLVTSGVARRVVSVGDDLGNSPPAPAKTEKANGRSKCSFPPIHLGNKTDYAVGETTGERVSQKQKLKLDLPLGAVEYYNVRMGTMVDNSMKGRIKEKLGKVNLFASSGGGNGVGTANEVTLSHLESSSNNDSVVLTGYRKLEQSISLPQNLSSSNFCKPIMMVTEADKLTLHGVDDLETTMQMRKNCTLRSQYALSMPALHCSDDRDDSNERNFDFGDLDKTPISLTQTSESMPDLVSAASKQNLTMKDVGPGSCHLMPPDAISWASSSLMPSPALTAATTPTDTDMQDIITDQLLEDDFAVKVDSECASKKTSAVDGDCADDELSDSDDDDESVFLPANSNFEVSETPTCTSTCHNPNRSKRIRTNAGIKVEEHESHPRSKSLDFVNDNYAKHKTDNNSTRDVQTALRIKEDGSAVRSSFIRMGLQERRERHIYEEIHLPPKEFRDPPRQRKDSNNAILATHTKTFSSIDVHNLDFKTCPINCSKVAHQYHPKPLRSSHTTPTLVPTHLSFAAGLTSSLSQSPRELDPSLHNGPTSEKFEEIKPLRNDISPRPGRAHPVVKVDVEQDGFKLLRGSESEAVAINERCTDCIDDKYTIFEILAQYASINKEGNVGVTDDPGIPPPPNQRPTCTYQSPDEFFDWENVGRGDDSIKRLVSIIGDETVSFIKAKEEHKEQLGIPAMLYSDFPTLASTIPYFHLSEDFRMAYGEGLHLIVCVHGLDGNSADLRLVKLYLELGLPGSNLEFLMSERNQGDTFSDFETMTDKLIAEIISHIEMYSINPSKISFIGHSLGNIIIRSALTRPELKPWLRCLHTFLSLSGPHLGTLYNSSGLVNMGMWVMQKLKKSGSLLQLSLKDSPNIRQTFLYRLSQHAGLEHFKNVLLFASTQDRYVPIHSARIELCKAALKDTSIQGAAYREMVHNLLQPVLHKPEITFIRARNHVLYQPVNSNVWRPLYVARNYGSVIVVNLVIVR